MGQAAIAGRFVRLFLVFCCGAAMLAACSTTGRSFDSSGMALIVPGQTTLAQASALLRSPPVNTYGQLNGAVLARWAHKSSLLTDAVYFHQELWLAFGPNGRFTRVVQAKNMPPFPHSAITYPMNY